MLCRPFAPLEKDNPGVGDVCKLCDNAILIGQRPSLIALPPKDEEGQHKLREGRAYTTEATLVHWDCVVAFDLPRSE